MNRREFITLIGGAAAAWPLAARAQQPARLPLVAILRSEVAGDPEGLRNSAALIQGLQALGWTEGRKDSLVTLGRTGADKTNDGHRQLLRARRERPRGRRAADERDELAPLHSITSSAMASTRSGTVSPSAFAVLRLTTSSNLVGC